MLSGDDSFVTSPTQSQIYSYIADNVDAVWNDKGELWAFVSDNLASTTTTTSPIGSADRQRPVHQVPKDDRHRAHTQTAAT